ncbi:hypothetical protein COLO4_31312 [Corchorus olitorius]|uniref:KIB1-4 beta-propeller domain-containing protein n=1 Tax=Corchorus olitorius TaxID=93759 RepID=A0A1R3H554_9ROSI|nr:hypothetical protein COLO4_31312 [Corchorus olitorius]
MIRSIENKIDPKKYCVAARCEGWLVYKERQSQRYVRVKAGETKQCAIFLWNPISLEKIELPTISVKVPNEIGFCFEFRLRKCILTAAPTTPQCLVVRLLEDVFSVSYCRPGDIEWKAAGRSFDDGKKERYLLIDAITYNEKIYALDEIGQLYELDIDDNYLKPYGARLPLTLSDSDKLNYWNYYKDYKKQFVESCGQLFVVRRKYSKLEIDVFVMDFSQAKWEKVFNLDNNKAFVLIGDYSISLPAAEVGIDANTIFFTDYNDSEHVYSYSMADKRLSVWRNDPNSSARLWVLHDEMMPKTLGFTR